MASAMDAHAARKRRACRCVGIRRSVNDYRAHPRHDSEVVDVLTAPAAAHPRAGFRKLFTGLRRAAHAWNHKRVWRMYCAM